MTPQHGDGPTVPRQLGPRAAAFRRRPAAGRPELDEVLDLVVDTATARRGDGASYEETLWRCVGLLGLRDAVVVRREEGRAPEVLAHTSSDAAVVEVLENHTGQGPCTEALTSGRVVLAGEAELEERWPRVATELQYRGFTAVAAVPFAEGRVVGLFADHPLSESDCAVARTLLVVATARASLVRELWSTSLVADQLQDALDTRIVVEQAKGVLSERFDIPVDAAFRLLREHARARHERLHDLAVAVVAGRADVPGPAALAD